jgi:cytochrome P450
MAESAAPGATAGPLRRAEQPSDLRWDPFDDSIKADPHPVWRRMRDEAPLYRNDEHDFWALSRFEDVDTAHRDPKLYSSAHGTVLELMGDELQQAGMMIFMDPPEHTRLRRLVSRAFTAKRVATLEGDIRAVCTSLLDAQRDRDSFDYVADFGARLPATVIAALLGVAPDEREHVRHMIDQTFHLEPGVGMINDVSLSAMLELHDVVMRQLDERRRRAQDDMMTDLIGAEVQEEDGTTRRLTPEETASFAILLVSAGTETVARLIGWSGYLLAAHPDQRRALAEDPGLIPNAVEEILRYEAPSPVQGRWVTDDVELYGHTLGPGSKVLLLTGSAGRDERRYPEADRFDVRRQVDHHVSFGYGIHFCLGAALARMEGRIALEETLARYPTWAVDHDRAVFLHTSTVRGYAELPIVV